MTRRKEGGRVQITLQLPGSGSSLILLITSWRNSDFLPCLTLMNHWAPALVQSAGAGVTLTFPMRICTILLMGIRMLIFRYCIINCSHSAVQSLQSLQSLQSRQTLQSLQADPAISAVHAVSAYLQSPAIKNKQKQTMWNRINKLLSLLILLFPANIMEFLYYPFYYQNSKEF